MPGPHSQAGLPGGPRAEVEIDHRFLPRAPLISADFESLMQVEMLKMKKAGEKKRLAALAEAHAAAAAAAAAASEPADPSSSDRENALRPAPALAIGLVGDSATSPPPTPIPLPNLRPSASSSSNSASEFSSALIGDDASAPPHSAGSENADRGREVSSGAGPFAAVETTYSLTVNDVTVSFKIDEAAVLLQSPSSSSPAEPREASGRAFDPPVDDSHEECTNGDVSGRPAEVEGEKSAAPTSPHQMRGWRGPGAQETTAASPSNSHRLYDMCWHFARSAPRAALYPLKVFLSCLSLALGLSAVAAQCAAEALAGVGLHDHLA